MDHKVDQQQQQPFTAYTAELHDATFPSFTLFAFINFPRITQSESGCFWCECTH